jgi:membrane protease YdiL (CAAX protease family)
MPDFATATNLVQTVQYGLAFVGLVLVAVWYLVPRLEPIRRAPARMPRWDASLIDTGLVCWVAFISIFLGQLLSGSVFRQLGLSTGNGWTSVLSALGFQGLLIVVLPLFCFYRRTTGRPLPGVGCRPPAPLADRILLGAAVFCIALPFVAASSLASTYVMQHFGLDVSQQELAGFFNNGTAPLLLLALTLISVGIVPIGEELLFRAGIFRILGRVLPRWAALLLSALAFAALHGSLVHFVPLTVLGIVFALAYEKTGSLLVPVIAHAFFNLNSIVGLLAGFGASS